ncbi:MAG: hypothetical protein WKG00_26190 [Polyangiaceae bacterium]
MAGIPRCARRACNACRSGGSTARSDTVTASSGGAAERGSNRPSGRDAERYAGHQSAAPSTVYLEFWRFLNSDYAPFRINTIDVWNGAQWINIWVTGDFSGVEDSQWTKVSHDLTAYKNAALKVRFGLEVGDALGAFIMSSWNIDDLVIANQSCN